MKEREKDNNGYANVEDLDWDNLWWIITLVFLRFVSMLERL